MNKFILLDIWCSIGSHESPFKKHILMLIHQNLWNTMLI